VGVKSQEGGAANIFNYGPYSFDALTISTMKNGYGVYGLAVSNAFIPGLTVVYVGKSTTLRDRLNYWFNNPPGPGITHFYAEAFESEAAMNAREEQLIKQLQPAYNTLLK
jgi:hypothetical protein